MNQRELDKNAARRLAIIRHAREVTGNVAMTCRYYGISRQVFYRWLRRYEAEGPAGLNARLRKVTRNRGQFPSEQPALKVLYLAVRNLEEFRGRNVGIRSSGWKRALQAFTIYFDGRIPTP